MTFARRVRNAVPNEHGGDWSPSATWLKDGKVNQEEPQPQPVPAAGASVESAAAAALDVAGDYSLRISPTTIDKLGVKLYDKVSAVVAGRRERLRRRRRDRDR